MNRTPQDPSCGHVLLIKLHDRAHQLIAAQPMPVPGAAVPGFDSIDLDEQPEFAVVPELVEHHWPHLRTAPAWLALFDQLMTGKMVGFLHAGGRLFVAVDQPPHLDREYAVGAFQGFITDPPQGQDVEGGRDEIAQALRQILGGGA